MSKKGRQGKARSGGVVTVAQSGTQRSVRERLVHQALVGVGAVLLFSACQGSVEETPPSRIGDTDFTSHPRAAVYSDYLDGGIGDDGDGPDAATTSRENQDASRARRGLVERDGSTIVTFSDLGTLVVSTVSDDGTIEVVDSVHVGSDPVYPASPAALVVRDGAIYTVAETHDREVAIYLFAFDGAELSLLDESLVTDPEGVRLAGASRADSSLALALALGNITCQHCELGDRGRLLSIDLGATASLEMTTSEEVTSNPLAPTANDSVLALTGSSIMLVDADSLSTLGEIVIEGIPRAHQVNGDRLHVVTADAELRLETWDISDPTAPNLTATATATDVPYETEYVWGPDIGYGIDPTNRGSLTLFDFSGPTPNVSTWSDFSGDFVEVLPESASVLVLSLDGGELVLERFDMTDPSSPTSLGEVRFGGGLTTTSAERIVAHFQLDEASSTLLVPYFEAAFDVAKCAFSDRRGVAFVDLNGGAPSLMGEVPTQFAPLMAHWDGATLVAGSSREVEAFTGSEPSSLNASGATHALPVFIRVFEHEEYLVRTWMTFPDRRVWVDTVPLDDPERVVGSNARELRTLVPVEARACTSSGHYYQGTLAATRLIAAGNRGYLEWPTIHATASEEFDSDDYRHVPYTIGMTLVPIEVDGEPRFLEPLTLTPESSGAHFAGTISAGDHLLVGWETGRYRPNPQLASRLERTLSYQVVDLVGANGPSVVSELSVPAAWAQGGFGTGAQETFVRDQTFGWGELTQGQSIRGITAHGAFFSAGVIASQHEEPVAGQVGAARYYLDRIDLSDPSNPELLDPINIPGTLLYFDQDAGLLATHDFAWSTESGNCAQMKKKGDYSSWDRGSAQEDATSGLCHLYERRLNLLQLDGTTAELIDEALIEADFYVDMLAAIDRSLYLLQGSPQGTTVRRVEVGTVSFSHFVRSNERFMENFLLPTPSGVLYDGSAWSDAEEGEAFWLDGWDANDAPVTTPLFAGEGAFHPVSISGDTIYFVNGPRVVAFDGSDE